MWDALSDERTGLSFTLYNVEYIYILGIYIYNVYKTSVSPGSVQQIMAYFLYYLVCEAIGTAATPALLRQPRVIVKIIVEKQMECRFPRETEVLGENLPQRHFCPSQDPT
jgi:hypothetical protein